MARQALPLPWTRATSVVICAELERGGRVTALSGWFRVQVSLDADGAVIAAGWPMAVSFRFEGFATFLGVGEVERVEGRGFVLSGA